MTFFRKFPEERCVFINCPFDDRYKPLFNALVFTVLSCGLIPLSAHAYVDSSKARLPRLIELMSFAKYSIHDLCRCHGEGPNNYARLNMPLELGISIGLSSANINTARDQHDKLNKWHLLVPNKIDDVAYQKFISDLQGHDPFGHREDQPTLIAAIMNIFVMAWDLPLKHTPKDIHRALGTYEERLDACTKEWHEAELPWRDTLRIAFMVAQEFNLITAD